MTQALAGKTPAELADEMARELDNLDAIVDGMYDENNWFDAD